MSVRKLRAAHDNDQAAIALLAGELADKYDQLNEAERSAFISRIRVLSERKRAIRAAMDVLRKPETV